MSKIKGFQNLVWFMLIVGLAWMLTHLPALLNNNPLTAAAPPVQGTATVARATDNPIPKSTPPPRPTWPTMDPAQVSPTVVQTFTAMYVSTGAPTATPWPSVTPLPTIDPNKASKFSVQNLVFGQAQNLNEKLTLRPNIDLGSKAWSPDGQWLLYTQPTGITKINNHPNPDGSVYTSTWIQREIILSSFDGQKKQRLDVGDDPIWSPGGSLVAYRSPDDKLENSSIRIIDVTTHNIISVTTMSQQEYTALAWLSESDLLYYQNTVMVFDYTTGLSHPLISSKDGNLDVYNLFVTQPKYGLIAVGGGVNLLILQRQNGQIYLRKQIEGGLDSYILAFSPDGTLLAYAPWAEQYEIRIASVDGANPIINIPVTRPSSVSWSPDSSSLAISWKYWDGGGIVMVNRDGSGLQHLNDLPHDIYGLTWHPQGTSLLFHTYDPISGQPINYNLPITTKIK